MEIDRIYNCDFREVILPKGITITDPPYNQNYKYSSYKDNLNLDDYISLLSHINSPCVIIHYPEETINILSKVYGECEQVVSWVYNSNTGKQHRLITWWGCKPDFSKYPQPYKNLSDKRIKKRISEGKSCKLYDWWEINQVKNVSKEKTSHPCQIPEEVIKRIILTTCDKSDLIIDPFCGSGTTCKVAYDLGYHYLGFDIDDEYCKIAEERIRCASNKLF